MRVLLIVATVLLSGCLAVDMTARATSGVVEDAASKKPLSGVSVFLKIGDKTKLVATTGADGRFSVASAHTAYVTIPVGDVFYDDSYLIFRASSYREERVFCGTGTGASQTSRLSALMVKLHKKI